VFVQLDIENVKVIDGDLARHVEETGALIRTGGCMC
jgi:hypothetical protein